MVRLCGSQAAVRRYASRLQAAGYQVGESDQPCELALVEWDPSGAAEQVTRALASAGVPVVWVARTGSAELLRRALGVGVAGVVTEAMDPFAWESILCFAAETQRLRAQIERQKLVQRAKAILMDRFHLTDQQAHERLQRQAMNRRQPLREVAAGIVALADGGLLGD